MDRHLSDIDLLDLLRPGVEADGEQAAHLAACPACRRRLASELPLTERLGHLERGLEPPRDLWPGVRRRIGAGAEPGRARHPRWRPTLPYAAAAGTFLVGLALGVALGRPADPAAGGPLPPDHPLAAAAEVQRSGTAYVSAVARFRATAAGASPAVVAQGREVTLATVHGAASELGRLQPDDATARQLVRLVSERP